MKTIDSWRKVLTMLMMVAMVMSCGSKSDSEKEDDETSGDPTATLVELTKELKKGDNLSANEIAENYKQALEAKIEFMEGDPSEKEIDEFRDAYQDYEKALSKAARDVKDEDIDEKIQKEIHDLDLKKQEVSKAFEKRMREKENK